MKILFVVPYVPSLIRVRPYNLVRHLSARGHRVTVATLWTNDREREDLAALRSECAGVRAFHLPVWRSLGNAMQALPTGDPLQARYSWSHELMACVASLSAENDLVHVEHLRGVRYGLALKRTGTTTPVVWDSVDCISHLFDQAVRRRRDRIGRWINQLELVRTRRYEGAMVSRFDRVLVSSPVDKEALLGLSGGSRLDARVAVLANGVDLDYFTPTDEPRDPDTVVFSGKMSYHANESAVLHLVQNIMPRVWATRPETRVVVVGKDPSRKLCGLLSSYPRVSVAGLVPDIRPYLRRAAVAAVPLVYGAGCQNKVLEAMACATPVVATPQAVSALRSEAGKHVLVADRPDRFADAVLELLADPRRQRDIGEAGRRYVEANHRWDRIAANLDAIYEDAVGQPHRELASRSLPEPLTFREPDVLMPLTATIAKNRDSY